MRERERATGGGKGGEEGGQQLSQVLVFIRQRHSWILSEHQDVVFPARINSAGVRLVSACETARCEGRKGEQIVVTADYTRGKQIRTEPAGCRAGWREGVDRQLSSHGETIHFIFSQLNHTHASLSLTEKRFSATL